MAAITRCARCGNVVSDELGGHCPECLLQAGLSASGPVTIDYQRGDPVGVTALSPQTLECRAVSAAPEAGCDFGGYHLVRRLGQGGMGTVFEAEERATGRRVALKVLSHSLDSPTARQRFLREGRLAASVNHPHSVYVFGTEEIEGAPVITMELVAGGTLQDQVRGKGALAVTDAVDATLQIIDGLEAAHAVGVLHRDVKPSNCFVDADGRVKIVDFGLSISKVGRGELNITTSGMILGTPAFASPEQLRGDELDERSDLYAVAVTLYYLLTGKVPFDAQQMVQLVAIVLEKPAPDVRTLRPDAPRELAWALQHCLEKDPARRFRSYAELRLALLPFSSLIPTAAGPAWRTSAGLIDGAVLWGLHRLLASGLIALGAPAWVGFHWAWTVEAVSAAVLWLLYFVLPEGWFGASLGKRLFGMRVVRRGRMYPPGLGRSALRSLIYFGIPVAPLWLWKAAGPHWLVSLTGNNVDAWFWTGMALGSSSFLASYLLWGLLFTTMRQRNGYAGIHDHFSGTRVIFKPRTTTRPVATLAGLLADMGKSEAVAVGPYHLLSPLASEAAGQWHLGYDARLLRKVWIHLVPEGTPPMDSACRNQCRAGRLRWLTGRRCPHENWDAFEAPSGQALWSLLEKSHDWGDVRYWLLDLSTESAAALKDDSLPPALGLDRVWITAEGRAKLLDFPAPGLGVRVPSIATQGEETAPIRAFLHLVAASGLRGRRFDHAEASLDTFALPLPLHARPIVEGLARAQRPEVVAAEIQAQLDKPTQVTRRRRLTLAAALLTIPLLIACVGALCLPSEYSALLEQPDLPVLNSTLLRHTNILPFATPTPPEEKAVLEVYITGYFGERIKDPAFWENPFAAKQIMQKKLAEEIVERTPMPTPEELSRAAKIAYPEGDPLAADEDGGSLRDFAKMLEDEDSGIPNWLMVPLIMAAGFLAFITLLVCFLSLACALLFRGGILWRLFGIDAVTRYGQPAARWRLLWRQGIVWFPLLFLLATPFTSLVDHDWFDEGFAALSLAWLGMMIASACLRRSLVDRLAGTWLVIR